jgi:integrase
LKKLTSKPAPKKFTTRWVESVRVPAGKSRVEYTERGTGLMLRISASGRKKWRATYRFARKYKRVDIIDGTSGNPGTYPEMSLRVARERAALVRGAVVEGHDPATEKRDRREAGTFAELAHEYIELHAKPRKRSWREDYRILYGSAHKKRSGKKPHVGLVNRWESMKVIDIQPHDVRRLLGTIRIDRGAGVMANRVLALLKKVFNYALDEQWPLLKANPCARIGRPAPEKPRTRKLSADEIRAMWTAVEQEKEIDNRVAMRLYLLLLQRGQELKRMSWADVDLESGWWTVPASDAKNGTPNPIPLQKMSLDLLRERKSSSDSQWVFSFGGDAKRSKKGNLQQRDLPRGNFQKTIERVRKRAGFHFTGHDLRRTAGTHMTSIGIPRVVVGKLLNHKEKGVTSIYDVHSYDLEKRRAMDNWADYLISVVEDTRGQVVPFAAQTA